ncbi:MAG: hypothetical protein ACUZ8H_16415 [Candidatus Anammoxibacter sp.]
MFGSASYHYSAGGFVPYIGANRNVNLGDFTLTAAELHAVVKVIGNNIITATNSNGKFAFRVTDSDGVTSRGNLDEPDTVAYGGGALISTIVGAAKNTAFGSSALRALTSGTENTAVGYQPLKALTTGYYNVAIGRRAGLVATTAYQNVIVGSDGAVQLTTGFRNTFVGDTAAKIITTGSFNVSLGFNTQFDADAVSNVVIGAEAQSEFDECIVIGRGATATQDNEFVLGSATYPITAPTGAVATASEVLPITLNGQVYYIQLFDSFV